MTIQMVIVEEAVRLPPANDIMEIRRGGFKGSATHRDYVLYKRLPVS
jgi:hypothetical protein